MNGVLLTIRTRSLDQNDTPSEKYSESKNSDVSRIYFSSVFQHYIQTLWEKRQRILFDRVLHLTLGYILRNI